MLKVHKAVNYKKEEKRRSLKENNGASSIKKKNMYQGNSCNKFIFSVKQHIIFFRLFNQKIIIVDF